LGVKKSKGFMNTNQFRIIFSDYLLGSCTWPFYFVQNGQIINLYQSLHLGRC